MTRPMTTRPTSHRRTPAKNRPVVQLDARLDKSLLAYAAAASAAGVSLLALAQPAVAKIVYTSANVEIVPKMIVNLDLNHDGIIDFKFSNHSRSVTTSYGNGTYSLKALPNARNAVWGTMRFASALPAGVKVGSKGKFHGSHEVMVYRIHHCDVSGCGSHTYGPWNNVTGGFLGLKFFIHGKAHYGWARLNVTVTNTGVYALLTGYAYETVANKPIITGKRKGAKGLGAIARTSLRALRSHAREQAGLGLLAQGTAGLDVWRKRDAIER